MAQRQVRRGYVESLELLSARTVEKFERGFVPVICKRQHKARQDATAAHQPMQLSGQRNLPEEEIQSETIIGHEQVM